MKKYSEILEKVRKLGKITIKITTPLSVLLGWNRVLRGVNGVAYLDIKLIRLHKISDEVVLEELLHLAFPEKKGWEIDELTAKILGIKPRYLRFLEEHVVAFEPSTSTSYVIPRSEIEKLKRRRAHTTVAITENGEAIYLSNKQKNMYWIGNILIFYREYFPKEVLEEIKKRELKAKTIHEKTVMRKAKEGIILYA